jgi:Protein of unknown function (DUF2796)
VRSGPVPLPLPDAPDGVELDGSAALPGSTAYPARAASRYRGLRHIRKFMGSQRTARPEGIHHMRTSTFLAAAMLVASLPAIAAEEHRELGPHEHGHGKLNIAVEGKRVSMELEVPGADIVGFEHEASTPEQKAAVEKAKVTLSDALGVFKLSAAAGCKLAEATVAIQPEDEHEHTESGALQEDADAAAEPDATGAQEEAGEEHHHSEFHVTYAIDCASPDKLTAIDFKYFDLFAGARAVSVNLVTEKGQTSYEVTREQPALKLGEVG